MKFLKLTCIFVLLMLINFLIAFPVEAAREEVNVGWYIYENSQEYDGSGNPIGYSQAVIEQLERYTNYTFNYIDGSFSECYQKLVTGELDLIFFVEYTNERAEQVLFSDFMLCKLSSYLLTLKSNEVNYHEIENLKNKRIGLELGSYQIKELANFVNSEVPYEEVLYSTPKEIKEALLKGEIDYAFLPSTIPLTEEIAVVENLNPRFANLAVNKNKVDLLRNLESALSSIIETNPNFFSNLYQIYYENNSLENFSLSKPEKEALEKLKTLKVFVNCNNGFLSRLNKDGQLVGIRVDVVKLIAKKLKINYKLFTTSEIDRILHWQKYDDFDFVSGTYYDHLVAEERGFLITHPYQTLKYYMVRNKNYSGSIENSKIAVLTSGNYFIDNFIIPDFKGKELVYCGSFLECISLVNKGKADITFLSSYMTEYYLQSYKYNNVSTSITDYATKSCFGARKSLDVNVLSAINKAIDSISNVEMEDIILKNTVSNDQTPSLISLIRKSPILFFIIFFVLVILFITLLMFSLFNRTLQKKNKKLVYLNNTTNEFLSKMSHDMRTPMNAILSFSALAIDYTKDPLIIEYLDDIRSSGDYLLNLINDVLDIQKINNQKYELNPEIVNLNEFFKSIFDMIDPLMKNKNITFTYKNDINGFKAPFNAKIDVLKAKQLFINILSNSVKFTNHSGTISLNAKILDYQNNIATIEFVIKDNGIGMSKEFISKMFNPFVQENRDPSLINSGSGLGLSIVKEIVTLMKGTVSCQSVVSQGTEMRVVIPVEMTSEQPKKDYTEIKYDVFKNKRILVFEDHELNIKIIKKLLEKYFILVDVEKNGQSGLDKYCSMPDNFYDLILMDIRMPIMDGYEATKLIRLSEKVDSKTIPIIAMSANAYSTDIEKSVAAGMNFHLSKPIDIHKLYSCLYEYLKDK